MRTTAYIRYGGAGAWSLADAAGIKQFFIRRFGRALPIGASDSQRCTIAGATTIATQWTLARVNPATTKVTLIGYLRANGIPFTAFYFAMPLSFRTTIRWAAFAQNCIQMGSGETPITYYG